MFKAFLMKCFKVYILTTDYIDTIHLINLLYKQGYIKKRGIQNALIIKVRLIKFFYSKGFDFVGSRIKRNTIKWINHHSNGKRMKIDPIAKSLILSSVNQIFKCK